MRRDLRLQQPQPRIQRLALELAAFELERQRLIAREGVALPQHRAERDPRCEQHAREGQHRVADGSLLVLRELRIAAGREPVREQRAERHRRRDADELQRPACEPPGQALRPLLEEPERQHGGQPDQQSAGDDDGGGRLRVDAEHEPEQRRDSKRESHASPTQHQGKTTWLCRNSGSGMT